jgi:hypothetical protein
MISIIFKLVDRDAFFKVVLTAGFLSVLQTFFPPLGLPAFHILLKQYILMKIFLNYSVLNQTLY